MKTSQTIALLVAALVVLTVAGCGTLDETITTGASTTGAPQMTTTTSQAASTTAATEQTTSTTAVTSDNGLAEEYDVYSALIESVYNNAVIVIKDTTAEPGSGLFSPPDAVRFMRNQWPELSDELLSDFQTKNETPSVLERRFTLSAEYVFISEQELESIFSDNSGWDDFYAKYPGSQGVLTLSRVGFNEAKDTAVLYAGNQSHWVAGEGNMVLMKKTAGRWTVEGQSMMWIS